MYQQKRVSKIVQSTIRTALLYLALILLATPQPLYAGALNKTANNLGLMGYWSFEDGKLATLTDFSGKGNRGTLTNFALTGSSSNWVPGKRGKALSFDGSNDYVSIGGSSSLYARTTDLSVFAWIKTTDTSWEAFSSGEADDGSWGLASFSSIGGTGQLTPNVGGTWRTSGHTNVSDGQWHHVGYTLSSASGGTLQFYLDGAPDGSAITSAGAHGAGSGIRMGSDSLSQFNFNGEMDEARFYARALSASEVAALYAQNAAQVVASADSVQYGLLTSNLVGYWSFDSRDINNASTTDRSGNGNHGSLISGSSSTASSTTFNASTTWVVPTGVSSVTVQAWGGGAAGANGGASNGSAGGGGGGGAYAAGVVSVTAGNSYSVSIGNGAKTAGGNGSDTWFSTTTAVLAKGGTGGTVSLGGAGAASSTSVGTTKYGGGRGGNGGASGGTRAGGGGGGSATASAEGGLGTSGGSSPGGGGSGEGGGGAGSAEGATATNGTAPGGGGGGGGRNSGAGGKGADGRITLSYNIVTGGGSPPVASAGRIGRGLSFSGNSDYVKVFNTYNGIKSVAFWVAPTSTTQKIIDLDGGTTYVEIASGVVNAQGFATPTIYIDGRLSSTFPNTNWHHVVVTTSSGINATNIDIGRVGSTYFGGSLDEVRLYSAPLTADEVRQLYYGQSVKMQTAHRSLYTQGLVGYWSFDGPTMTNTTSSDSSGSGNHGTRTNGPVVAIGNLGQALSFDGVDDYVLTTGVPSGLTGDTAITMTAWVKPRSLGSLMTVANIRGGYKYFGMLLNAAGAGSVGLETGSCGAETAAGVITANEWQHIAIAKDPGAIVANTRIYINGVLKAVSAGPYGTCTPSFGGTLVQFGAGWDSATEFPYNGVIDDVRVYNRALSATEILGLYNATK